MSNRLLGSYDLLNPDEPDFTPSDAISLALLWDGSRPGNEPVAAQYRAAYLAVCVGLGLEPHDPARLTQSRIDASPESRKRNFTLRHLVRLRANAVRFCDEWGGVMEGDIWGELLPGGTVSARLHKAREWYGRERAAVRGGLPVLDAAICTLLGWNPDAWVTFRDLQEKHGFQTPDIDW